MRSSLIRPVWWSTSYLFRWPRGISMITSTFMLTPRISWMNNSIVAGRQDARSTGPPPEGVGTGGPPLSWAHPRPVKGRLVRRPRTLALAVLALLNVLTLVAGLTVARMLPPRLARLHVPVLAARPVVNATPVLTAAGAP